MKARERGQLERGKGMGEIERQTTLGMALKHGMFESIALLRFQIHTP
jgi:hypothetical protein